MDRFTLPRLLLRVPRDLRAKKSGYLIFGRIRRMDRFTLPRLLPRDPCDPRAKKWLNPKPKSTSLHDSHMHLSRCARKLHNVISFRNIREIKILS